MAAEFDVDRRCTGVQDSLDHGPNGLGVEVARPLRKMTAESIVQGKCGRVPGGAVEPQESQLRVHHTETDGRLGEERPEDGFIQVRPQRAVPAR